ncbi:uncharacterized protein LOC124164364 [Ischnura elegans]|uniref:uncharacterized protein LOC124164364 n=1 Tax=Ischnura elegans TaxID=197161 RepID=UPI001ED8AEAC|nr:uncharacterized protein LOC124164364 [Ischnura elegans]
MCIVKGRICPEHRVRNTAYAVEILINEEEEKITSASCKDCIASQGGCKHALAFLMWLHRRSEDPAPTDVQCFWKKPRLSTVGSSLKFVKASDFPRSESSKWSLKPCVERFLGDMENLARENNIDCQLARSNLQDPLRSLSLHNLMLDFVMNGAGSADDFLSFSASKLTNPICGDIASATAGQSSNLLWQELRYGRVTASKVYGVIHSKSVGNSFVQNIIGTNKLHETVAMARGRNLELLVLRELMTRVKENINQCGILLFPGCPIAGASPDGIAKEYVVEIKCPFSSKAQKKYILKNGKIASKYLSQIQMQMHASGRKRGLFCVADWQFEESRHIDLAWVDYDREYCEAMVEEVKDFWKKYIFPQLLNAAK